MKNKNLIYGAIGVLVLITLSIFIWNSYQIEVQGGPAKPIGLPTTISGECGIENCHGLEISCGANVPEFCTEIYMAGDNCRRFVSCISVDDQCKLEKSPKFDSCKSCVEECEQSFQNDQIKFFECESSCTE